MQLALAGISSIAGLVSFVCWIMTVVKMFQDSEEGGVGKAIGGIICALYALVWGFQTKEKHGREQLMMAWGAAIGVSMLMNVLIRVMAS